LDVSDYIMVARGDLGIEISVEKVPMVQKSIIKSCNEEGTPVITATEMLESMMNQPRPTRAEVSDVANAILDGTDANMLSGETSVGEYPVKSVNTMHKIAREIEPNISSDLSLEKSETFSETISKAIHRICKENTKIDKIVTLTRSGFTARMISRFRLSQPILAVTPSENICKRLKLIFGVEPLQFNYLNNEKKILSSAKRLLSANLVGGDDFVLFTAAIHTNTPHTSNLIEVHRIENLLDR